ncbi:pyridoxamine 5'-phosphate oxidase family protein [Frateuria hangzhouensis]|uniref:pyridoxamine 5'-phosphate oxidase family protein n=1 Tax=Frateuria hangzhouensis TaxID=2995589 RepID=UPI002260F3F0|nr:pyridoxamine 5'-phosphate oxidase family protein [Frateuria sp. STR12]MCX7514312.1 pyridoxamine 5'-phosphate oxidase family protein [Frateuria sp. STR12]
MKNDAPHDAADLRKLAELIEDSEVAMLTTQAADGSLVSRPLQTLKLTADGELVFFTAADSAKVDQLTDDLDLNLAYANHDDKCYVSVRGRARIDRDPALIEELWSPAQNVFFSGKDDPNLTVLRVRVRDAMYWESADSAVERALDFARGMWNEQPSDLGRQGHLHG